MAGCVNNTKKLKDFIEEQKGQHNEMNVEFNWPDLCKHIPKCVLYRANQLRQIAVKGLGQCSYKVVDQFLMFTLELLVSEDALTNEKFTMLKERAGNLTFEDAQTMLQIIIIIREKFSESVSTDKPIDSNDEITGNTQTTGNLFGLKLWYKSGAGSSTTQTFQIVPLQNTDQSVDDSSSTCRKEETKPLTVPATFNLARYEEKLNEYYEKHSPVISRQAFKNTIIDILQCEDSESELTDFLGCDAMELTQYIIENRENIIASDPEVASATPQKKCSIIIEELLTLLSEEDKELWKNMEKLGKKLARHQANEKRKE